MKVRTLTQWQWGDSPGRNACVESLCCPCRTPLVATSSIAKSFITGLKTLIITTVVGIGQVNMYVSVYKVSETEGGETMASLFFWSCKKDPIIT